jgi:hypothetical protein
MRKITLAIIPIVASAALLLTAVPAYAAGTGTTFELLGGTLTISAPAGPVSLGTATPSPLAQPIQGSLGNVTVSDSRGNILGWVTTALSSNFVSGALTAVPATAVSYGLSVANVSGTAVVAGTAAVGLAAAKTVETATGVLGAHTATWDPQITILVPGSAQAGLYTATLTHSVS